ncbi:hypothetical protein AB0M43_10760 [Longispora sp. NPDC051575]|uniref:hypothetical protein n=1 Tax=Longispora sp. NPDC051575 TaxID=3154943 RepID=UPI003444519F
MRSPRALFLAAPLLLAGYGVVRLIGRMDDAYGPGPDWQVAHALGLAGLLLFAPVVLGLGRMLPATWWRTVTVGVTLAGLVAMVVQFGVDIVQAALSADKVELTAMQHDFQDLPGVVPAVYSVGPQLFFLGLIALTVLLAVVRRAPWWCPVLTVAGVALPPVSLDLLPVSGLLFAAALFAVAHRNHPAGHRAGLSTSRRA